METPSSPSTCLSLSSDFMSPSNSLTFSGCSYAGSWPNSCTSSPKRAFMFSNSSSSCPSSPKRLHFQQPEDISPAPGAVDCTLSLGNASTRRSSSGRSEEHHHHHPPNRLSRAGSPSDFHPNEPQPQQHPQHSQQQWPRMITQQQQRGHPSFSYEVHHPRHHQHEATHCSEVSFDPPNKFIISPQHHHHQPIVQGSAFGYLHDMSLKSLADPCSRSRFRGGLDSSDPRNTSRVCAHCGTSSTPLWRNGPLGPKSLCNACGIRFKKVGRRSSPVATPPSPWPDHHHHHQQALEIAKAGHLESPSELYRTRSSSTPEERRQLEQFAAVIQKRYCTDQTRAPGRSHPGFDERVAAAVSAPASRNSSPNGVESGRSFHSSSEVLDAEVIRSVPVFAAGNSEVSSREDQGRFLRMAL